MRALYLLVAFVLVGCTQDFGVFEGDGSAPDATTDAPNGDAGTDATPPGDGGLSFQCNTGTVADCSQCSGATQGCVFCGAGSSLAGRCVAFGTSCFGAAPTGFSLCSCSNASTCPVSYDVCRNGTCRTCGDSFMDNSLTCKGGGTCHAADGGCF